MAMAAPSLSIPHSNLHHYSFAISSPPSPPFSFSSSSSQMTPLRLRELLAVRSSKAEGPLRRPAAPTKEAASPPSTIPAPLPPSAPPSPPPSVSSSAAPSISGVTIEYQRQRAKELQEYFLDRKYEEQAKRGRIFGWVPKNEISNGRYMLGHC
ncbi:hypothetical protein O6H91_17G024300 [Diphasiastrum complanatum]|uniref:Uncharacterized protein n=1 Tax=Diphasiastrum complanatum TaxID=34168 RepID=A0ACC2B4X9_DIPCM|nr:hypothetical protein O6H91_17G024300 [Diphasiastrum complanatum]